MQRIVLDALFSSFCKSVREEIRPCQNPDLLRAHCASRLWPLSGLARVVLKASSSSPTLASAGVRPRIRLVLEGAEVIQDARHHSLVSGTNYYVFCTRVRIFIIFVYCVLRVFY